MACSIFLLHPHTHDMFELDPSCKMRIQEERAMEDCKNEMVRFGSCTKVSPYRVQR